MSNPGVIELFGFQFQNNSGVHSFRVEDNIGEAIHVHFDKMRLDLTVKEFRELADDLLDAITADVNVKGFDAKKCDSLFFYQCAKWFPWLREVRIEYMPVKDIIVDTLDKNGDRVYRYMKYSRVVRALQGDCVENDNRKQINLVGLNNRQRLAMMFDSVKKNGYPYNDEYIILFNDQNIIRDGQHRAASIYVLNPDAVIPIQRWIFQDNRFSFGNVVYDLD